MPFQKLQFRPGINRETTSYTNEGGWYDMDKVRFRFGSPEKIGGWERYSLSYYLGSARALHAWVALDGSKYIGVGTHLKYYVVEGGAYNDITPIGLTTAAGDVTFQAAANTLASGIGAADVNIVLTSSANFPTEGGRIKIGSEVITYGGIGGGGGNTLLNCVRGVDGTTAAAHSASDAVLCSTITVSNTGHGALVNDFVTFSGSTALGGNATAAILDQEYQITKIVDADNYQIELRAVATIKDITGTDGLEPTYVYANSSDTGTGGTTTVGTYQINTGLDTTVTGTGWGAGTWGRGTWGSSTSLAVTGATLRIWSHDNFGEDLIINVRNGGIFYWDKSAKAGTTPFGRAVELSSLTGATKTPQVAKSILVSDRDRHIIAFGCDSETNPGVQDPLLIRFSSQESPTDWESTATNTAGDLRIGSGSEIVASIETRQQVLVFTDVSLHAMQYLGPPFTFGINTISENITIAGPLAAAAVEDMVFWMGAEEFYIYGGAVNRLPCSVRDYVFGDINDLQLEKVQANTNTAYSEVWWFYPSANSEENDRYVVYNYQQKIWYYGTIERTVWMDRGTNPYPIAASTDHSLYYHELGLDDDSTVPAQAITAYIESSAFDLGEGDNFMFIRRLIPDMTFRESTAATPKATMTLKMKNFPGDNFSTSSANEVSKTAAIPVEQFTDQVHIRLRGRSMAFRIESNELGVAWRLGSPRVDIRGDGKR